jgi:hypothetical protein
MRENPLSAYLIIAPQLRRFMNGYFARIISGLLMLVTITLTRSCALNPVAKGQVQINASVGFSSWGVLINVNYHFNHIMRIPRDWDFYAGLNLGFYVWTSPDDYDGDHTSGLGLGGQIGGRYYFTNALGVNLEFGGGNALNGGKIGLSIKL